jgi:hypothetical protein
MCFGSDGGALRPAVPHEGSWRGILLGQAVDRPLADKRVDARLLVEGNQFAERSVAIVRHAKGPSGVAGVYANARNHETMREREGA